MYYDRDDNIDNINVPDKFVEITTLLRLHQKNIRKKIVKMIYKSFDEDCEDSKKQIMDIIEYAIFSGGKHYRSFFVELLGRMFNLNLAKTLFVGAIIEMVHHYIIMQNAMPEFENNDYRHNRESCHKKFGNAQTIIASNALYSLIMEIITDDKSVNFSNEIRCQLVKIIAKASGKDGVIGGQMMKLISKTQKTRQDEEVRINKLKMHSLFQAGAECIMLISGVSDKQGKYVKEYINNLCNLISIYDNVYLDNEDSNLLMARAKLLCNQGVKNAKKIENSDLLIDFIEYNYYCINQLYEKQKNNKPIVVSNDKNEHLNV